MIRFAGRTTSLITALALAAGIAGLPDSATARTESHTRRFVTPATSSHANHGTLRLQISGKTPAQVTLVGPQKVTVAKPSAKASFHQTLTLKPGRYRVRVPASVYRTRLFRAKDVRRTIRVSASRPATLNVILHGKRSVGAITVTSSAAGSLGFALRLPHGAHALVRMAPGGKAPRKVSQGQAVEVNKKSAVASGLVPGQIYSFALFRRVGHRAVRLATTTASVSGQGGQASYALLPTSTLLGPSDTTVSTAGGALWWNPKGAMPPLNSGVALAASPALPYGFVGYIVEISPDGHSARLASGGLGDVFSYFEVTSDLGGPPTATAARGAVAHHQPVRPTTRQPAAEGSGTDSCPHVSAGSHVTISPVFTPGGSAHVSLRSHFGIPYQVDFDVKASLTLGATMDVSLEAAVECGIDFPPVIVQLAETPVPLLLKFDPKASVEATGKLEFKNVGVSVTGGFYVHGSIGASNAASGGLIKGVQPATVDVVASGGVTVTLGGTLTIGPGAGTAAAGAIVGVSGTFDPLKASLAAVFPLGDPRRDQCAKLDIGYDASLGIHAEAWMGHFSISHDVTINALSKEGSYLGDPLYYPDNCEELPNLNTGDFEATLGWGSTADLDLHVTDPDGEEIYYEQPSSDSGGRLDVDANAGCYDTTTHPVENIYWPPGGAPSGTYYVQVVTYASCNQTNLFWHLQVRLNGNLVLDKTGVGTSEVFAVSKP